FASNEIGDVDQELGWSGQLGAEILENFAEDRHYPNNQECSDRKGDADHDDRIGHGRFNFLAQTRAGFKKSGKALQNLCEQTAAFTSFHHADEEPIENAGMFRDRFVKCFSALDASGDVADDVTQAALAFGIALVVKRGQSLDQ